MQKADSESRFGACGRAGGQVRLEASAGLAVFPSSMDAVIARQEAAVRCKRETDKGPKFCPIWVALKRMKSPKTLCFLAKKLLGMEQLEKGIHLLNAYCVPGTVSHFLYLFSC